MGILNNLKEKWYMYDMIIANMLAGNSIIEPTKQLDNTKIAISFSNIASESQISKYFLIRDLPDYLPPNFMDLIRSRCIQEGVKINYYIYAEPHKIRWDSAEMRNRLQTWKKYAESQSSNVNVFEYRTKRSAALARERIIWSTKYLNEAEVEYRRTVFKVVILIEISSQRDEISLLNLSESLGLFKSCCAELDIKYKELKVNMLDWLSYFGVFSLKQIREISTKVSKKILTDDILANFNGYKQGRVGNKGVPLGIDVKSGSPVLKKFKMDPDAPENWFIAAETGGGKSYFVKTLLTYLLADNFVVTVMDYEGDEYFNLASYLKAANPDDVKVISMGKGSTVYFDPMEIADLTGDEDIDKELKETAIAYTLAIFRVIVGGLNGELTKWEEKVISTAIKRVYDKAGVTDDKSTWYKSKGLRIKMVYDEIKGMVRNKELVDDLMDNVLHKAAVGIETSASVYFEEGEAKAGTFRYPMSVNELYRAKFIVFSFGMRGATSSQTDPKILALKQLSVANVAIQISNYCKYIKKCFNVKVWEEFQRWGEIPGSAEIIVNAMTGGRKRGDVNFILTNNLLSILDDTNEVSKALRGNMTSMVIGKIKDRIVRDKLCEVFGLQDLKSDLDLIAKAYANDDADKEGESSNESENRYKHSFCVVLDNGKKAITKVKLPPALKKSSLFKTGVQVNK